MRQVFLSVSAFVLLGATALAQHPDRDSAAIEAQQAHMQAYSVGDYMGALKAFGDRDPEAMEPMLRSSWNQFRPALDGFVAQRAVSPSPSGQLSHEDLALLAAARPSDAISTIVERARHTRIVIVNETHDNPRDRAFIMKVAEALHPLGYTHYAAETLANWGNQDQVTQRLKDLSERGYPVFTDGFYSSEPTFGNLLRRVLALGYYPVSYEWMPGPEGVPEDMGESVALREKAQAENLARALAAAGSDAKFLIHVGYSHAAEEPLNGGQEWMAAQLKALTGTDPLTVDQTDLSQYSRPAHYAQVAPAPGAAAVVLFDGNEPVRYGRNARAMDLQVVHPPIRALGGRPDWLASTERKAVRVPAELMPRTGMRILKIVVPGEPADAVPIDVVLVKAGDEPPLVYVPAEGPFDWAVQDGS
jgi:hypothetical protein